MRALLSVVHTVTTKKELDNPAMHIISRWCVKAYTNDFSTEACGIPEIHV